MATRLQRLRRGGFSEFPFAGPAFLRVVPWLLGAVFLVGLVIRLVPAVRYGVWGSDQGEYQFLTRRLVETGRISFDYNGWGVAYPYFPGLFVVSGSVTAVLGVDLFHAVEWTVPVLSATIPLILGLLAYRATSDPRVAVLAAAFVATSSTIVITGSHAMPATLGQVLLVGMIALLPDAHRDRRIVALLIGIGAALVLTHHLTTYFAIGIVVATVFWREMSQVFTDHERLRVDVTLAASLLAMATVWWLVVARPFRDEIVGTAFPLPAWATTLGFLLALAALPALVIWKRQRSPWTHTPRYPSFRRQWRRGVAMAAGLFLVVLFVVTVRLPGSSIRVDPIALLFVVPVLGWLAFLPVGHAAARFHRQGALLVGWLYAVLASLAFAIVTNSHVLFPFRHVDYMIMGMAPLAAIGMMMVYDQTLASRVPEERARMRATLTSVIVGLVVVSAVLSLPPRQTIGGFEEGITDAELDAVRFAGSRHDIIPAHSTIAADHRVSSLLFGLSDLDPTWDYTPRTYHAESTAEALDELANVTVPPRHGHARIDYVFLSPEIEKGVTLLQWENSAPMSQAAIGKFEDRSVFEPVYNESGVRIFRVLWPS